MRKNVIYVNLVILLRTMDLIVFKILLDTLLLIVLLIPIILVLL
jgi:hypothetical protein